MKSPGLVSNSLLVASGSMNPVYNSAAIINEMRVAFGRQCKKTVRKEKWRLVCERVFGQDLRDLIGNDIRLGVNMAKVVRSTS